MARFYKGMTPWNKGLTKADKRVLKYARKLKGRKMTWGDKVSATRIRKFKNGELVVSEDTIKKLSESHKGIPRSKKWRENLSRANKGHKPWITGKKHRPETIKLQRKIKLGSKNPMFGVCGKRNPRYGKLLSKITIEKIRVSHLGLQCGCNNPNWHGGTARLPYLYEFFQVRPFILNRDSCLCRLCLKKSNHVHHIDYNRDNNRINNLMVLCRSHHSETNGDREFWSSFLSKIV